MNLMRQSLWLPIRGGIAVLALACLVGFAPGASAVDIKVIAHRGAHDHFPENTLPAIRRAIELGCDYVEVDVRETQDGRLVLMHDSTVDRMTDGVGRVDEFSFAAIRSLKVVHAESDAFSKVPTFAEALRICRGKIGVLIDNKAGTPSKVVAAVSAAGMVDQVVVYSNVETLRQFQREQPRLKIQPPHPDSSEAMKVLLSTLRPETVDGHVTEWNKVDVTLCREAKVEVWVDVLGDSDSEEGYRRAIELGVDVIQTDYPVKAKRFLKAQQR